MFDINRQTSTFNRTSVPYSHEMLSFDIIGKECNFSFHLIYVSMPYQSKVMPLKQAVVLDCEITVKTLHDLKNFEKI